MLQDFATNNDFTSHRSYVKETAIAINHGRQSSYVLQCLRLWSEPSLTYTGTVFVSLFLVLAT